MENNLFQQAKSAISRLNNAQNDTSEKEKQAAKEAIEQAYTDCTAEEKEQLQQLEQSLNQNNQLS